MDPSSANNFSMPKTSKTLVLPSRLPLSRPCFGLLLLLPPGQLNAHPTSRKNNSKDSKINLVPHGLILKPESLVNEIDMRHQLSNNQSQQISLISQISTERPSCAYYQFSEHSPVGHASHQKSGRETNSPNRALVGWKGGSGVKLLMLTLYRDHRQCDRFLQLH